MTTLTTRRSTAAPAREAERGQIIVLFTISLVVIMAMVGLALDAGSTFAQRRGQQLAADLASLAAANDYLLNNDVNLAIARAQAVVTANGYTDGVANVDVTVDVDTSNGASVTVGIAAPHSNSFLGAIGMPEWDVATRAVSLAGFPDTAYGASPFVFSIGAFEDDGTPKYQTSTAFGDTNGHAPTSPTDFAWTNFGIGNVNTSQVRDIIDGDLVIDRQINYGDYIGQHNNGNHTALFGDVDTYLSGKTLPVAVVDDNGNFMGWASFHVESASGGSDKHIQGYFVTSFQSPRLTVGNCAVGACPRYLGSYVLKLID
jgi:hypothetical protein